MSAPSVERPSPSLSSAQVRARYGEAGLMALTARMRRDAARIRSLRDLDGPLGLLLELNPTWSSTPALRLISAEMEQAITTPGSRLMISLPPQEGKAVDVSEPVLTTRGWSTMGDLVVGDEVFHPDGHPTRVVAAHPVRHDRQCYRVTTVDGRSIVVDSEHLWTVQDQRKEKSRGPAHNRDRRKHWETATTAQLVERGVLKCEWTRPNGKTGRAFAYRLPRQHAVVSKPADLPIDPYVLGAWLGDGDSAGAGFTSADEEIVEYIRASGLTVETRRCAGRPYGWYISRRGAHRDAEDEARRLCEVDGLTQSEALRRVGLPRGTPLGISTPRIGRRREPGLDVYPLPIRSFVADLRELGVLDNKHVPEAYLTAGTEQRLALLQGLMDTDGTITTAKLRSPQITFTSCKQVLAAAVLYLARSLGWRATISDRPAKIDGRVVGTAWSVKFTADAEDEHCPFRLRRKADRLGPRKSRAGERHAVSIASIEPVESRPVRCITVDREDGLFLAGRELMATHNSRLARHAVVRALQHNPDCRIAIASYQERLARKSGEAARNIIVTRGSKARDSVTGHALPDQLGIAVKDGSAAAGDWSIDQHEGGVLSVGVGSGITGNAVDLLLVDDPLKGRQQADSEVIREALHDWWDNDAESRLGPHSSVVIIQTRWHEDDLIGRLLQDSGDDEDAVEFGAVRDDQWRVVNIPALADGETLDSLADVPEGRTDAGWLVSARGDRTPKWRRLMEKRPRVFSSLYQGRPAPLEGGIFQRSDIEVHRVATTVGIDLLSTVIAVDPADTGQGDAAGILVGSRAVDGDLYVRADLSGQLSQRQWARRTLLGSIHYRCDTILQESNLGMGRALRDEWALIRRQAHALRDHSGQVELAAEALLSRSDVGAADVGELREVVSIVDEVLSRPSSGPCHVKTVTPRQSKYVRAKGITGLYEMGRAHHVGSFQRLEHQMTTWQEGQPSPNELDTLAHLLTFLDVSSAPSRVATPAGSPRLPTRSGASSPTARPAGVSAPSLPRRAGAGRR